MAGGLLAATQDRDRRQEFEISSVALRLSRKG